MARKQKLDDYESKTTGYANWFARLTKEEQEIVESESDAYLRGEYPKLTSVSALSRAMRSAGVIPPDVTEPTFRRWFNARGRADG